MKKYIVLAAMALIVVSCEIEDIDNSLSVNDGIMRIDALHPSATRVTETAFEKGDVIGVYATTYNGDEALPLQISGNWINNEALTYNGSSWGGRHSLYWCNEGVMDVYGYYPYMTPTTINKHRWSVQLDQSTPATENTLSGYEASDFLWAKAEGALQEDGNVQLQFKHMCSKLVIKLVKGEKFTDIIPEDTDVYLYSTIPTATIDFTKGIVSKDSYGTKQKIKARRVSEDTFEVIVVPQSILEYSPFVEIVIGSIAYMTDEVITYYAGVQYTVSITLDKSPDQIQVELGGIVEDWD